MCRRQREPTLLLSSTLAVARRRIFTLYKNGSPSTTLTINGHIFAQTALHIAAHLTIVMLIRKPARHLADRLGTLYSSCELAGEAGKQVAP